MNEQHQHGAFHVSGCVMVGRTYHHSLQPLTSMAAFALGQVPRAGLHLSFLRMSGLNDLQFNNRLDEALRCAAEPAISSGLICQVAIPETVSDVHLTATQLVFIWYRACSN